MQGSLGNDVDFTAQKVFQILAKDDLIQEAAAGFQVDKDIHIALWANSTPGHGAEETEVRGAVFGSQSQDLVTFGLELSFQVHPFSPHVGKSFSSRRPPGRCFFYVT